ncbi:MAG: hypothetical protein RLN74_17005 [Ilumatobacter fluminis]|uniref:hypothetical protein n=1 Tax=Ilumatobacter fluminis TaxID=467091 RepID=UPI0032EAC14A
MTDGREELRDRVRSGEIPTSDAAVVIRGGPDTLSLLRSHARRLNRAFLLDGEPVFGVSVFVALDDVGAASERGVLSGKLRSYPSIYRCRAGELFERGLGLLPTFARPHYTVLLPELEAVDDLAAALGTLLPNPYAEG